MSEMFKHRPTFFFFHYKVLDDGLTLDLNITYSETQESV